MSVLAARAGMMMQRSAQDRRKSEMSSGACSPEVLRKWLQSSQGARLQPSLFVTSHVRFDAARAPECGRSRGSMVKPTLDSLGSDRFRIFSAQAEGEFQCHEISPRVRLGLEQSRAANRADRLGTGRE